MRKKLRELWEALDIEFSRRERRNISIGIVLLVMALGALLPAPVIEKPAEPGPKSQKITLPVEPAFIKLKDDKMHKFELEIAKTPVDIQMGLMFRQAMSGNHGIMFQYGRRGDVSVSMKNTYLPLDILFVEADGTIVTVHRDALPNARTAIDSDGPVTGVVELSGGTAARLGIQPGDKVIHPYFSK